MDRLLSDIVYSVRRLARAPGFTTVALLTLALGIGANTAIFSVVKSVLLQPLPYQHADRVVMIWGGDRGETSWMSAIEIEKYGQDTKSIEQIAAYDDGPANLTGGAEPERVTGGVVTPNMFQTLGVTPLLGRTFVDGDATEAPPTVVMLSEELWRRRFGGDPNIIGTDIHVNGRARTVIGVLPKGFRLPLDFSEQRPSELFTPMYLRSPNLERWGNRALIGVARLREGAKPENLAAEFRLVEQNWVRSGFIQSLDGFNRRAIPIRDFVLGDIRRALMLLSAAVGVVLLIACANVANLLLARSDERQREIVIRSSLGASRMAIVRQLLTESVLLALTGGVIGTAVAYAATRLLVAFHPPGIPRLQEVSLDAGVLAFALLMSIITGILFGLVPALSASRPDLSRSLKEGGRTGSVGRSQQRFRDSLVVGQMAFSVVLLVGALLLVRSFAALRATDLGFHATNALTFRVSLPQSSYPESQRVIAFYRNFQNIVETMPGVRSAGATRLLPLTGTIGDWSINLEGRPRAEGENPNGDWQVVTPGYLETMGVALRAGRYLSDQDTESAPIAAVVNETMAKRYWNGDALGKRFHIGSPEQPWITVVGVIGQVHHNAVVEEPRAEMYVPHAQWQAAGASTRRDLTFVVRTTGEPMGLAPHVRSALRKLDPTLPLSDVRTLKTVVDNSLAQPRFTTALLGMSAALALTLAMIGIYGVIALIVTRRRQEIGIRMALGAKSATILGMVVRRGMALAGLGLLIGMIGALWVTQALTGMLHGVGRFDPITFAVAPLILGGIALLACAIPAVRAARVDPLVALRDN